LRRIKKSITSRHSIFGLSDLDPNDFRTFATGANSDMESFVFNFQTKTKDDREKELRYNKFAIRIGAILERSVNFRYFDFWLPFRRYDMAKRDNASISYEQPTIFKIPLNDKIFEDDEACKQLIKEQRITLRKVSMSKDFSLPLNNLDFSRIEEEALRSPNKQGFIDDSVDMEFRRIAMQEDDLNDTALDLYDILKT
jgi:hypothetical protein